MTFHHRMRKVLNSSSLQLSLVVIVFIDIFVITVELIVQYMQKI